MFVCTEDKCTVLDNVTRESLMKIGICESDSEIILEAAARHMAKQEPPADEVICGRSLTTNERGEVGIPTTGKDDQDER